MIERLITSNRFDGTKKNTSSCCKQVKLYTKAALNCKYLHSMCACILQIFKKKTYWNEINGHKSRF